MLQIVRCSPAMALILHIYKICFIKGVCQMRAMIFCFLFLGLNSALAQDIPKDSVRLQQTSRYMQLPNFPTAPLEFIRDSVENDSLMAHYLKPQTIKFIKGQHLHWLQVRDVYIDKQEISVSSQGILIPVIAGVRYQKYTDVIDGTLNGLFRISSNSNNQVTVDLVAVDDNAFIQAAGRFFWRVKSKQFVNDIAGDTLRTFFSNPETVRGVLLIAKP
jgi:hypothetical protein